MLIVTEKIDEILKKKKISRYKLSQLIGCTDGALNQMIRGDRPFSKRIKNEIVNILDISEEEFEGWILADKYSKRTLRYAIKIKQDIDLEKFDKKQLILTQKIDNILEKRNMSRTALSKIIEYNQSALNQIITGKRPMSKAVLLRIALIFEIPQDKILAWTLVDKYDVVSLETAVDESVSLI